MIFVVVAGLLGVIKSIWIPCNQGAVDEHLIKKQTSVHLTSQLRQHKKLIYLMSQSKFKGLHRQVNLRQFLPWFKL